MGAELFDIDLKDIKRLQKFYKRAPRLFAKAAAGTLNAFAFGTRKEALKIIGRKFIIRDPKFVASNVRVQKARANVPLHRLIAGTGGSVRPRYTALAEQETGKAGKRDRTFTLNARGGDKQSKAKGWARLKPGANYPSPGKENLSGLTGKKRIVAFLSILNESKRAQTFILRRRFGRFKRGLYRFRQGKIKQLQSFDARKPPRRVRWLTGGRQKFMTRGNILTSWADAINFQLRNVR